MALLWTSTVRTAPLWQAYILASQKVSSPGLSDAELGEAVMEKTAAHESYLAATQEAELALQAVATEGIPKTHVLVIAVGEYDDPAIPPISTSTLGAWSFAEFMLNMFNNPACEVASLEIVASPGSVGPWVPSPESAAHLGIAQGTSLPVEAATFANIKGAFERWLARSGTHADNAAFFYFAGHGAWARSSLLIPADGRLPSVGHGPNNLIDMEVTESHLFNVEPALKCFFLDSCSEVLPDLSTNPSDYLGEPLARAAGRREIRARDSCLYYGSYIGRKAYGPDDQAPFFTQELQRCLQRRGAARRVAGQWRVTTGSLRTALFAAADYLTQQKGLRIEFSFDPGRSNVEKELCRIGDEPEVFVYVWCTPNAAMGAAEFFVEDNKGGALTRSTPAKNPWLTSISRGTYTVGARFPAPHPWRGESVAFEPYPPLEKVEIIVGS
jgi:hypothetical protein